MLLIHTLRGRLALVILLSSLLTLITILLLAYRSLVQDLESELSRQQAFETRQLSNQIEAELALRLFALESLAQELSAGDRLIDQSAMTRALTNRSRLEALFPNAIIVLDNKATAIAETNFVPGRLGTNYADRPHFSRLLRSNEPVISQPIIGRTTGLPLISFLHPILGQDNQLLGIVGGTVDLSRTSVISAASLESMNRLGLQVLDSDNFYYVQGNPDQQGLTITELPDPGVNPLIDQALQGISTGTVTMPDGSRQLYATAIIPTLNWVILKANPVEEILAPAQASFREFLLLSVAICLVLASIGYWAARRSMRPLSRLTRQIQSMAQHPDGGETLPVSGIDEIRDLTEAFNALTEERSRLNQLKEEFVSTVSHELRTPLTAINGALGLLNSGIGGTLPDKAQELVELSQRNTERLQSLIQDLLDFNKLQAGRMAFNLQRTEAKSVLHASLERNKLMANHYQVHLALGAVDNARIHVDPGRLQQIIDNYVTNAIKHAPAKSQVTIDAVRDEAELVISVCDQGTGVPEHFVEQLFTRFAQAEVGTTRAIEGTGLGLAICKEIADHMGGHVGYHYDEGARFWVRFPTVTEPLGEDIDNSTDANSLR